MMNEEQLRYPAGRFVKHKVTDELVQQYIDEIASLPAKLSAEVVNLSNEQLDTSYRPGGWTLRQVVHHLPDSHINAYVRIKLTVTEDNPAIRPYLEARWAECEEARTAPVQISLELLESLHKRWVLFLRSMQAEDLDRTYYHPEHQKNVPLREVISMYAWHGRHHLAHITQTKKGNNW